MSSQTPFWTPSQKPPAGSARWTAKSSLPKLFQPWTVRGHTFQNRIALSPMVQQSSKDGHHTPWHLVHYGSFATRGPAFVVVEATAVEAIGKATLGDSGLWKDSQIEPMKRTVDFVHSQNQSIFVQLYHAGRKSGMAHTWESHTHRLLTEQEGGFPDRVVGPSEIPYDDLSAKPSALTTAQVKDRVGLFKDAAVRALKAGFDGIEVHAAHGYLIHSFLSGVSNDRTDDYGGSFENRIRFLVEIVDAIRSVLPEYKVLLVRISATDGLEGHPTLASRAWDVDQSARLASVLADHKVDILDVSSYSLHKDQTIARGPAYQAPFAKKIKKAVGDRLIVGTVGGIDSAELAEQQLQDGLDYVSVGRGFLMNQSLVQAWGRDLGVEVRLPVQYAAQFGQTLDRPGKEGRVLKFKF